MTYYDATATKSNTLTPNSQEVIAKLDGGLTITTYVNALDVQGVWMAGPDRVKEDEQRFRQYVRFKSETKMKYVYYYDTIFNPEFAERYPNMNLEQMAKKVMKDYYMDSTIFITPKEIRAQVDLFPEGNRFVRLLERENGKKTFLRIYDDNFVHPSESEITAAFKRLTMEELPKVGFLVGHGERNITRLGDRDYNFAWHKHSRHALINQGFDVVEVGLDNEIPADVNILVIAEMRNALNEKHKTNLDKYIARGGNLFILSEPNRSEYMSPLLAEFGVSLVPGILVRPTENFSPELVISMPSNVSGNIAYHFGSMYNWGQGILTETVSGLAWNTDMGYEVTPLFLTDSLVWNELETSNFVDDTARLNPEIGEKRQCYATALALSKKVNNKEQRVLVFGDADCLSNGVLNMGRALPVAVSNPQIIMGGFYWLANGEVPIDVRRPSSPDDALYVGEQAATIWKAIWTWVLPGLLVVAGLILWIRRRSR